MLKRRFLNIKDLQLVDDNIVEDEREASEGYEHNYCFVTRPLFLIPLKVVKRCLVTFVMVVMGVCHLLLGRPW